MDLENTGKNWKEEAPLLAAMERKNSFTVPENYFNGLAEHINSLTTIEDARFKNEDEFSVPAGYFDNLAAEIESQIIEQDLKKITMAPGFSVPENYFNDLEQTIRSQIEVASHSSGTIVKSINHNWIKYAAAACITVVLGSALVFNTQNTTIESQLNKISDQEIVNYLQINSNIGDTPLIIESLGTNSTFADLDNGFTDAELEEYINTSL